MWSTNIWGSFISRSLINIKDWTTEICWNLSWTVRHPTPSDAQFEIILYILVIRLVHIEGDLKVQKNNERSDIAKWSQ